MKRRYRRAPNTHFSGLAECTAGRSLFGQAQANGIRTRESFTWTEKPDRQKNRIASTTPLLHYSTTPLLQYSTTPLLHYSNTPILHYSITPLLHYSITPLLHYSITPLLHYSITPLLHYSTGLSARHAQNSHQSLRCAGLNQRHSAKLVNGKRRSHRNCRNICNNRSVISCRQTT